MIIMTTNSNKKTAMTIEGDTIDLEKNFADSKSCESVIPSEHEETDLENAIQLTGFGWFHAGLIVLCGSGFMLMSFEAMGISFILPAAQCDLALTTAEKGYLSGATFFGMVVSAHMWGFCADTYGRKKILLTSIVGTWAFSFVSSFSPTAKIFIALRFFTGFFLCGNTSTIYAYLSEFLHSSNRSKIMTWTCGSVAIAYLVIPGLAWILIPLKLNWDLGFIVFKSWRLYIVVLNSISFAIFLAFLCFPESPKFLMCVGRKEEALKVLRNVYAMNTWNSAEKYPVKSLKFETTDRFDSSNTPTTDTLSVKKSLAKLFGIIWRQTAPIFSKPYGWRTLLFCSLQFGMYLSSGGLYLWMPNLLNIVTSGVDLESWLDDGNPPATICEFVEYEKKKSQNYSNDDDTVCNSEIKSEVYMSTLVVGLFFLVTYSSYGMLISKFGNKTVAVSALLLGGIAAIGLYFARNEIIMTLLLSSCVVLTGTCISVLGAAIVDAYPTNLRAMAVSLALTSGRLGTGVAGNVVGILVETYCDFAIIGLGCIIFACSFLCIFLPKK